MPERVRHSHTVQCAGDQPLELRFEQTRQSTWCCRNRRTREVMGGSTRRVIIKCIGAAVGRDPQQFEEKMACTRVQLLINVVLKERCNAERTACFEERIGV